MSVQTDVTIFEEGDYDLFDDDLNFKDSKAPPAPLLRLLDCFGEIDVDYTKSANRKSPPLQVFKSIDERLSSDDSEICQIILFQRKWDKGSVVQTRMEDLFKMARKDVALLASYALANHLAIPLKSRLTSCQNNILQLRTNCVDLLWFIDEYFSSVASNSKYDWCLEKLLFRVYSQMEALQKRLGPITLLPESIYLHPCNPRGNQCEQPSYHLFHLHLDFRWMYLNFLHKIFGILNSQASNSQLVDSLSISKVELSRRGDTLMHELVDLAFIKFEKICGSGLCRKSPFICGCVQDLWVYLNRFYSVLWPEMDGRGFWSSFCGYLEKINSSMSEDFDLKPTCVARYYQQSTSSSKILFSLWLLSNVSTSHKSIGLEVSGNSHLLENLLKSLVNDEISETELNLSLPFIEHLCLDTLEPRVEPIVTLWEYFYKKLNSSFYVPGSSIDSIATLSKTANGILRFVKSLMEAKCSNIANSYQHFIRIVGLHLRRTQNTPRHWNVIKGRIFSKMSGSKLGALSQQGEHHVVVMFLTLAMTVGVSQVECKFMEVISTIKRAKGTLSSELIQGMMAFIVLSIHEKHDVSKLVEILIEHVNSTNPLEGFDDLKKFATEVEDIFCMNESLGFGLHIFVDSWMLSYLTCCAPLESNRLLESITVVVNRLKVLSCLNSPGQETILFVERLWEHLSPYFNNMPSQAPLASADLAASMVALFMNTDNHERATTMMNAFVAKDNNDIWLIRRFITKLLINESIISLLRRYNKIIIKTWIRCCILCNDTFSTEMKSLTIYVSTLDEIKSLSHDMGNNLTESRDPLLYLCSVFRDKFESTENIYQKQNLRDRLTSYLDGIDRWLKVNATSQNFEMIQNLYKACGNMIRLCYNLIYIKSRPKTVLQQIVDSFLLPATIRNPENKLANVILQAVKESLHLFIEGLYSLSITQDSYITRIFKELIAVYIPRCVTLPSPLPTPTYSKFGLVVAMSSFDCNLRCSIFEVVSEQFLKKKNRTPHHFTSHALQFLKDVYDSNNCNDAVLKCFIKKCFERIGDVILFCDPKSAVFSKSKNILKTLLNAEVLREDNGLMDTLSTSLEVMCDEHLAWSSRQLFDFIVFISNDAPDVVVRFIPQLLDIIKRVEKKRGVGYDKNLRLGLERVESALRTIKCQSSS